MNQAIKTLSILAFALVFMTGAAFAQNDPNEQTIEQLTNANQAEIQQVGPDGLKATIIQRGNSLNEATIRQNVENGKTIESTIEQVGRENRAITNASRRAPNGPNGLTTQEQIGDRNEAFINLDEGDSPSGDEGSTLMQFQEGNGHFAIVSGGNAFRSEQRQYAGDRNRAEASGFRSNSSARQIQEGSDNVAVLSGGFGSGANATQEQYGSDNVARFQLANVGSRVTIEQLQDGSDITSIINEVADRVSGPTLFRTNQVGDNNLVRVEANGFGGGLEVDQLMENNTALVTWNTDSFTTIYQGGTDNTAVVN